jgi:integrin alpha 8
MVLEVLVSNFGEDAFEAGYYMTLPHGLNFKKIERIGDIRDTPITCTAPSAATNNTLKCDIGNPLSSGKVANFKVILNPSDKSGLTPEYEFFMEANSTNAEQEGAHFDNVIKKSIQIWVETDLSITG